MTPPSPARAPHIAPHVLRERLASICQALGAIRVGLARRLLAGADDAAPPFRILATVDAAGEPLAEDALPLVAYLGLLQQGRLLEATPEDRDALGRGLVRFPELAYLMGFPLPADRSPSILIVAGYPERRRVGSTRLEVAQAGMRALAQALAPAPWLPLASVRPGGTDPGREVHATRLLSDLIPLPEAVEMVERVMLQRALRVSEGNRASAARLLQMSRQGLTRKLRKYGLG